jgi:transposase
MTAAPNELSIVSPKYCVIFRKVTGGFRSQWGATLYAGAASVIATGKLNGQTALQALQNTLQTPTLNTA